ncbi:major facilitator superfamily domain-containing protein [Truncatella angustata]|uniref:Major facilitator superfamily domain-containing protein n=1 Tax=Truncatella angustata TaxID=152316 RepID=A0A9P8UVH1_9PEZI|nr:major facilitator superfamily domain-containing protein [Truncatella angustata]KAH6659097.1 major facilitator superfamily domain-containing protein [Truncatella angustata]
MSNRDHNTITPAVQVADINDGIIAEVQKSEAQLATESVKGDEPPDGGVTAWLQVLGSFCLFWNHWGLVNAFGVFQTYYQNELLTEMSPSAISWIGSIQSFLLLSVGVLSGPLYDKGYLRSLLLAGSVLIVIGLMMTSLCTQFWQLVLAQAICIGTGTGILYIPSLAVIPQYFHRRKALALGLVVSGSSCGGVVYSIIFTELQPRIGFGWTLRVMGLVALAMLSIGLAVVRRREEPSTKVRTLLDLPAFKERPYVLYCATLCTSNIAFFTPIFYMQPFALVHGLQGQDVALYLVAIMNACSVVGRLAPSLVANKIGPVQTLLFSVSCTAITVFAWIATTTGWGNIAFAAFFGFFSGAIVALPAVVLTSFTPDLSRLGTRLGMSSVLNAVGSLIGTPIGGAILSATGSYLGVQLWAGSVVTVTAFCLLALRFSLTGMKLKAKA